MKSHRFVQDTPSPSERAALRLVAATPREAVLVLTQRDDAPKTMFALALAKAAA